MQDDGMWLLQPAQGRTAIRKVWRDWLRSVPDYHMDVIDVASDAATNDAFVMWRASGMAKLSLIPQRPTTNKPFQHYGVTR
jgi:N-acetylglutamate synthase/N-acetylornithine aminotransferase